MERASVRHEVHVLDIKSMQGPQMLRVDDVHRGDEGIPWIVRGDENREMPIFFSLFPTRHVIVGIKAVESPDQSPFFLCREFEERRIRGHALTARGLDTLARSIIFPMMKKIGRASCRERVCQYV